MVELRINGKAVVLQRGAQVEIEHLSTLLSEGIEDSFSLPFTVPIDGNEQVLGHAAHIALKDRPTKWEHVELWAHGVLRHPGTLHLENVLETELEVSLSVEGFVSELGDKRLRELDMGTESFAEAVDHAEAVNAVTWPEAPYCFPMYRCIDLYDRDLNPDWYPNASQWAVDQAYTVDDIVEYESGAPVRRKWIYQCIQAHTASGLITPDDDPSYWQRLSNGTVNLWNFIHSYFPENSSANYWTLVPWPYLKEVVKRTLAALGYQATGDWMDDERYHRVVLAGNTTLDDETKDRYFHVANANEDTYSGTGPDDFLLVADDESTVPYEDAGGVWSGNAWTCPQAGFFTFRIKLKCTTSRYTDLLVTLGELTPSWVFLTNVFGTTGAPAAEHEHSIVFSYSFGAGDVGKEFAFCVQPPSAVTVDQDVIVQTFIVQSWVLSDGQVNGFQRYVDFARHVPDMTVAEFLLEVRDLFGLRLKPNSMDGTVRLDYRIGALQRQRDISTLLRSTARIEPSSAQSGVRLSFANANEETPELAGLYPTQQVDSAADLTSPTGPRQYATVANERRIYLSQFLPIGIGGFYWYPDGTRLEEAGAPAGEGVRRIDLNARPVRMGYQVNQANVFLVPVLEGKGESAFFRQAGDDIGMQLAIYHGLVDNGAGAMYPFASPYDLDQEGDSIADVTLDLVGAKGLVEQAYAGWLDLVGGDAVVVDLEVDAPDLFGQLFDDVLLLHSQPCLLMTLPLVLDDRPLPTIARGARLLKLRPR